MLVAFTSINLPNVKAQEYGTYNNYDNDMYSTLSYRRKQI